MTCAGVPSCAVGAKARGIVEYRQIVCYAARGVIRPK
jgi:hypothetical protein